MNVVLILSLSRPTYCWMYTTSLSLLTYSWMYTTSHSMFLWQDNNMRRKAHHLMWPGKPFVDDRPALLQREGSLRQMPWVVMQNVPSCHNWTVHSPNRRQPGMGSRGQLQMKPAAKMPAPNAVKVSAQNAGIPIIPQDEARDPYKPQRSLLVSMQC